MLGGGIERPTRAFQCNCGVITTNGVPRGYGSVWGAENAGVLGWFLAQVQPRCVLLYKQARNETRVVGRHTDDYGVSITTYLSA